MRNIESVIKILEEIAPAEGCFDTASDGISVIRVDKTTPYEVNLYDPAFYFILQGRKAFKHQQKMFDCGVKTFMFNTLPAFLFGSVRTAADNAPFLCIKLSLNVQMFERFIGSKPPTSAYDTFDTIHAGNIDAEMTDNLGRILRCLQVSEEQTPLLSLFTQELYWRIAQQSHVLSVVKQLLLDTGHAKLKEVIRWINEHYEQKMSISSLASKAAMSESSFFANFKQLTGLSPLQYRNHLRVIKARNLMLTQRISALEAGATVGYLEPSQFSREYSRVFGLPPRKDIQRIIDSASYTFA